MSVPTLTPVSTLSAIVLPVTGATSNVNDAVPYKIYSEETSPLYSSEFISGAVDQVSYVYKKLGGDILDLEITEGNVYAAYEEAVPPIKPAVAHKPNESIPATAATSQLDS